MSDPWAEFRPRPRPAGTDGVRFEPGAYRERFLELVRCNPMVAALVQHGRRGDFPTFEDMLVAGLVSLASQNAVLQNEIVGTYIRSELAGSEAIVTPLRPSVRRGWCRHGVGHGTFCWKCCSVVKDFV